MSKTNDTAEALLQHASWMRRLARSLVRDAALADDLTQDAMVIALQSPPADHTRIRGWLATVMRRLAGNQSARATAERRRESIVAMSEQTAGDEELVDRIQTERAIADALVEIEEPFRTTLLLRYYEDLPPREIARRTGVAVATVKSRLSRGLDKLRQRLDSRYPDRRTWIIAVARLAGSVKPAIGLGTIAVVIAAVATTAGIGAWLLGDGTPKPPSPTVTSLSPADPQSTNPSPSRDPGHARRSYVDTVVLPPVDGESQVGIPHLARGVALDDEGRRVPGVSIRRHGDGANEIVMSDAEGTFAIKSESVGERLVANDDRFVTIRAGITGPSSTAAVVVARAISIQGIVVDHRGIGVPDASVRLFLPERFEARFSESIEASIEPWWITESDALGRFTFDRAPSVRDATLSVSADAVGSKQMTVPQLGGFLRVEIPSPSADGNRLRGKVLLRDGSPAPGARVSTLTTVVTCDQDGVFALDRRLCEDREELIALHAGVLPERLRRPKTGWPQEIVFRLGEPTGHVRGRVFGPSGLPCEGAKVFVSDPTPFGSLGQHPLMTEALLAGGLPPAGSSAGSPSTGSPSTGSPAAGSSTESSAGSTGTTTENGDPASSAEALILTAASPVQEPDAQVFYATTDKDGRFTLPGLLPRAYELRVLGPNLAWMILASNILPSATERSFKAESDRVYPRVRGAITTHGRAAIAGVTVQPWIVGLDLQAPISESNSVHVVRYFSGPATRSDAQGNYELTSLPREGTRLYLYSDQILPSYASLDDIEDPDDHDIIVPAKGRFRVELSPPTDRADRIAARDANGRSVQLLVVRADGYSNVAELPLIEGRSGIVAVTTDATELVFRKRGKDVFVVPIDPTPGEVQLIRR